MSTYVTLEQAKAQAGIPAADITQDTHLQLLLDAAERRILNYLDTDAPTPGEDVQLAVLAQFTEYWRFRGDDPDGTVPKAEPGEPAMHIRNLLYGRRSHVVK